MNYTEMTNDQLEKEQAVIAAEIDKLYDKQEEIQSIKRERELAAYKTTNDILQIKNNSYIMAIAKHEDYHYSMFQIFHILEVGNGGFQVLEHKYRQDDSEYSYRIERTSIYQSAFYYLKDEYILISIEEEAFNEIHAILSKVNIDYTNWKEFSNYVITNFAKSRIEV